MSSSIGDVIITTCSLTGHIPGGGDAAWGAAGLWRHLLFRQVWRDGLVAAGWVGHPRGAIPGLLKHLSIYQHTQVSNSEALGVSA